MTPASRCTPPGTLPGTPRCPARCTSSGRRPRLLPLAAALPLALGACDGSPARPHVLILSLDSVRADHVSAYGRANPLHPDQRTTPAFERLAAEGVLFETAVSTTSWTLPSHMALLTGLPDGLHGVYDNEQHLDPALETLPELLGRHGYARGGFFSGPNLHPAFGFAQGFETYENCGVRAPLEVFESEQEGRFRPLHRASHDSVTSDALVERAGAWIGARLDEGERPFFAFVHWWDPHYDYLAPAEYVALFDDDYAGEWTGVHVVDTRKPFERRDIEHVRALYDAEIRYTDDRIAELLALLDERGVAGDTLVVLTSDHGEEFYERSRWGHQRSLYDEVLRIPLVLRWPGRVPAGVRVRGQARLQDVYATVADLVDVAPASYVEARSLAPLWEDPAHPGYPQPLLLRVPHREIHLSGLRDGERKVLWDHVAGRGWIWNLARDANELRPTPFDDLATSRHPGVTALREWLAEEERRRAELPRTEGHGSATLSEELRADLRAHGYL